VFKDLLISNYGLYRVQCILLKYILYYDRSTAVYIYIYIYSHPAANMDHNNNTHYCEVVGWNTRRDNDIATIISVTNYRPSWHTYDIKLIKMFHIIYICVCVVCVCVCVYREKERERE